VTEKTPCNIFLFLIVNFRKELDNSLEYPKFSYKWIKC